MSSTGIRSSSSYRISVLVHIMNISVFIGAFYVSVVLDIHIPLHTGEVHTVKFSVFRCAALFLVFVPAGSRLRRPWRYCRPRRPSCTPARRGWRRPRRRAAAPPRGGAIRRGSFCRRPDRRAIRRAACAAPRARRSVRPAPNRKHLWEHRSFASVYLSLRPLRGKQPPRREVIRSASCVGGSFRPPRRRTARRNRRSAAPARKTVRAQPCRGS